MTFTFTLERWVFGYTPLLLVRGISSYTQCGLFHFSLDLFGILWEILTYRLIIQNSLCFSTWELWSLPILEWLRFRSKEIRWSEDFVSTSKKKPSIWRYSPGRRFLFSREHNVICMEGAGKGTQKSCRVTHRKMEKPIKLEYMKILSVPG